MLRNYLIIAWRNLWKHKLFSFINLAGLTISLGVALVVYLIVQHEFGYDRYHPGADRIFRVVSETSILGEAFHNPGVPIPLAQVVKDHMTGIDEAVGFFQLHDYPVKIPDGNGNEKIFKHQDRVILTDPGYFRIFNHQWVAGDSVSALKEPFQVVLTEAKAKTYFGVEQASSALGRVIIYRDSIETVVAGIIKDHDKLTDFGFQEIMSISTVTRSVLKDQWYLDHWDNIDSDFQLMVKLSENVSLLEVSDQLISLREQHQHGYNQAEMKNHLQPLRDLHFSAIYGAFLRPVANRSSLVGLITVAILLLTLGSINYINLTIAAGTRRSTEIGVRKTLGGARNHLMLQFLTETGLLTILAALSAYLIAPVIMNLFQDFLPVGLTDNALWKPSIILFLISIALVVGVISGIYPGAVLSKYQPVSIFKKSPFTLISGKSLMQLSLTVIQFAVATFFIISTLIVALQVRHALNLEMGFNQHGIVTFFVPANDQSSSDALLQMLKQIPEIENISRGNSSPASTSVHSRDLNYVDTDGTIASQVILKYGDENYLDVYNLQLLSGSNISNSDTIKEYVINESFMKRLGITQPAAAIGQMLEASGGSFPVVGVVSDFHTQPIRSAIGPTAITNGANGLNFHVKLYSIGNNTDTWSTALYKMEEAWRTLYPEESFDYSFYDQRISSWYQQDQHTSKLLRWVTGIAIFISCLGLLGLVILITTSRTKEIGIRQVLGASAPSVVILLSKGFFKLILIAIGLSIPIAWFFATSWLEDFAYPIELSWWMFILPAGLLLVFALMTISSQVVKVALSNPVESLRYE